MNFWECLPAEVGRFLKETSGLREIRLRNGKAVKVNVNGKWYFLGRNKLQLSPQGALCVENCDEIVKKACNSSVYAYEKMLAQGYFTLSDGSRVGVCGVVGASGSFKKYTSLCMRLARYVGCATTNFCDSVVVAGPPRSGKTTFLRDFACKLSHTQNVVVVDERGEFSACRGFDDGFCDVLALCEKKYAFEVAVRSLSPDWIVCDELAQSEFPLLENASASGVKVAASLHAENLDELSQRLGSFLRAFRFAVLLQKDTFVQQIVDLQTGQNVC